MVTVAALPATKRSSVSQAFLCMSATASTTASTWLLIGAIGPMVCCCVPWLFRMNRVDCLGLVTARRFGLDRHDDSRPVTGNMSVDGLRVRRLPVRILFNTRIGISQGSATPWRWYLRSSRSVSRRAQGDAFRRRHSAGRHLWSRCHEWLPHRHVSTSRVAARNFAAVLDLA